MWALCCFGLLGDLLRRLGQVHDAVAGCTGMLGLVRLQGKFCVEWAALCCCDERGPQKLRIPLCWVPHLLGGSGCHFAFPASACVPRVCL